MSLLTRPDFAPDSPEEFLRVRGRMCALLTPFLTLYTWLFLSSPFSRHTQFRHTYEVVGTYQNLAALIIWAEAIIRQML